MFDSIVGFTATLRTLDAAGLGVTQVEANLDAIRELRACVTGVNARLLTRSKELADAGKGAGPIETLTRNGDTSTRHAANAAEQAETLDDAPEISGALISGSVSEDHVDALTAATRDLPGVLREQVRNDPDVADAAQRMGPDAFATFLGRRVRRLADADSRDRLRRLYEAMGLRMWVKADGTHVINGQYDAEHGSALFAAIQAEMAAIAQTERRPFNDHTRALALAALTNRGLGAGPNHTPADVTIIDIGTLAGGSHDHTICETDSGVALSPGTIRRYACHARITAIVLDPNGVVLDAGREIRTANRAQRRALRAMYKTCAIGDCHVAFPHCQIHHLTPWEYGGQTDLANLLPVCGRHHHLVHEGGWQLHLAADRTLTVTRPDSTTHRTYPLPSATIATHLTHDTHEPRSTAPTGTTGPPATANAPPPPTASRQLDNLASRDTGHGRGHDHGHGHHPDSHDPATQDTARSSAAPRSSRRQRRSEQPRGRPGARTSTDAAPGDTDDAPAMAVMTSTEPDPRGPLDPAHASQAELFPQRAAEPDPGRLERLRNHHARVEPELDLERTQLAVEVDRQLG